VLLILRAQEPCYKGEPTGRPPAGQGGVPGQLCRSVWIVLLADLSANRFVRHRQRRKRMCHGRIHIRPESRGGRVFVSQGELSGFGRPAFRVDDLRKVDRTRLVRRDVTDVLAIRGAPRSASRCAKYSKACSRDSSVTRSPLRMRLRAGSTSSPMSVSSTRNGQSWASMSPSAYSRRCSGIARAKGEPISLASACEKLVESE
jgi:hypothetical protein